MTLLHDFRHALRSLLKAPAFSLAATLTLALGIGATTALFSLTRQLLLGHLPYPEPERLVVAYQTLRGQSGVFAHQSLAEWRDQSRTFTHLGGYRQTGFNLTDLGEPRVLRGARISAGFLEALQVRPHLGRLFTRADEAAGASDKVILTYGTWRDLLGSDPAVLGRRLVLDGRGLEVVGVLPRDFLTPFARGEGLFKIEPNAYTANARGSHAFEAVGRLAPGATLAGAREELALFAAREAQAHPDTSLGLGAAVTPLREALTRDSRQPLLFLLAATGLLLVIACVNVTNLFLARAAARERDMAVRLALGAGRRDLLATFLAEALLVAGSGVALALLFAQGLLGLLEPLLLRSAPASLLAGGMRLSLPALALSLGLTLTCALVVALAPTLQADRLSLRMVLSESGRGLTSQRGQRFRQALVSAQVGLCLLLVLSTALFMRSLLWIEGRDPGFRAAGRLTFTVSLPARTYATEDQIARFYQALVPRLQALPGVASAAGGRVLPFSGSRARTIVYREGQDPNRPGDTLEADMNLITPDWFRTLGTPLVEGRLPQASDLQDGLRRIWISRSLAQRLYPGLSAVGRRMHSGAGGDTTPDDPPLEIAGVVADVHDRNLERAPEDRFWLLHAHYPDPTLALVLETDASPAALRPALQAALRSLDPDLPVTGLDRLQDLLERSFQGRRMVTALLGGFTLLALLLAAVGIHGVVAFQVAQRTREIGIRMALGAEVGQVLALILGQGLRLTAWGLGIGLLADLALARVIRSQIHGVQPLDPLSLFAALALLGLSAALASLLPALRAARVDPAIALRSE